MDEQKERRDDARLRELATKRVSLKGTAAEKKLQ